MDACRTSCRRPSCGDGVVDSDEECDEGNANSDTRANACRLDCRSARCGDGTVDFDESCDDGPTNSDILADACRTTCVPPSCGDAVIDSLEQCDDGNYEGGDGCSATCAKVEICGDKIIDDGEDCDDGNNNPADGCHQCRSQWFVPGQVVSGNVEGADVTGAAISSPTDIAFDQEGRLYFTEPDLRRVRRLDRDGTLSNVMGVGIPAAVGNGMRASVAGPEQPTAVAVDAQGNVHVTSRLDGWVLSQTPDGRVQILAGDGSGQYTSRSSGDSRGSPFGYPGGIAVDGLGRVYVTDTLSYRLLRIRPDNQFETLAGYKIQACKDASSCDAGLQCLSGYCHKQDGALPFASGLVEGPPGTSRIGACRSIDVDEQGNTLLADVTNHAILHVDPFGELTIKAGGNGSGSLLSTEFEGRVVPAAELKLKSPLGVLWDGAGGYYIADSGNNLILHVDTSDTVRIVAGTGRYGFDGDGDALSISLAVPRGMALHPLGGIVFADTSNNRIRWLNSNAVVSTLAGNGLQPLGDGGRSALESYYRLPQAVATSRSGRVLFSDLESGFLYELQEGLDATRIPSQFGGGVSFESDSACTSE
ncbi:MAG: DUF4215 domain-containing protein, partial [Myxococcota bacterium]